MSKHKTLAILMAPFLAIGGYIAAGYFTDNESMMRTLILEEECRLAANKCILKTPGLELSLSADKKLEAGSSVVISVNSSEKLNDVLVSFAAKKEQSRPHRLKEKENNSWRDSVLINKDVTINKLRLRLVVDWQKKVYFADEKITQ